MNQYWLGFVFWAALCIALALLGVGTAMTAVSGIAAYLVGGVVGGIRIGRRVG